ncbi:MAG TPA: hypothetical protein VI431_05300 [Candidatus Acidoferrum sp.]
MMLLAKAALGFGGAFVLAGAYTFHEGLIRIDVDESRAGGSHVHMWVPAAVVPMVMHLVPKEHLRNAAEQAREALPAMHAFAKELKKYPDVDLIEVNDGDEHAQVRTRAGKLLVDVDSPKENVHIRIPLSTIDDVVEELESGAPGA